MAALTFEEWKKIHCKPVNHRKLFDAMFDHGPSVVERVQIDIALLERSEYGKYCRENA